ncbi:hypothetical protein [Pseudoduganella violacea]|uniref:Uncharacterized protein n=1 Tax=Pseudoduganella violacea TaxID=1715466 RepID=A0A7W5BEF8_9BURK|nr:hypothetical protein [Pseudoduganella violacea]MBB3121405.1 hypothetical protein [Pseudoduganella violacea]
MRKIYIYILGVVLLGLVQGFIKNAAPHGAVYFLIIVAYLVILRVLAEKFGKP